MSTNYHLPVSGIEFKLSLKPSKRQTKDTPKDLSKNLSRQIEQRDKEFIIEDLGHGNCYELCYETNCHF